MEFEIAKHNKHTDKEGNPVNTYKIFIKGSGIWISDYLYANDEFKNYFKVIDNKIVLKDPISDNYLVEDRKNKKGKFKVLLPMLSFSEDIKESLLNYNTEQVKEPEVAYKSKTKSTNKEELNKLLKQYDQNIETTKNRKPQKPEQEKPKHNFAKPPKKESKQLNQKSRQSFITSLMPHIKNADKMVRDRYFELLSKEMEGMPKMEERIMLELGEIKERIEGKARSRNKDKNHDAKPEKEKNKFDFNKLRHNPKFTSDLLKKFKYKGDDVGFKYLVHKPNDEKTFSLKDYDEIVKKSENYFDELKKSDCLHPALYTNISELIKLMGNEGKIAVEKTKKHPFDNIKCDRINKEKAQEVYKNISNKGKTYFISWIIKNFKKNYRFANETSEATILKKLIVNAFNKNNKCHLDSEEKKAFVFNEYRNMESLESTSEIKEIHKISINFEEKFELFASFFTWVPNINYALAVIADDILKHCNYNGMRDFQNIIKEVFCSINKKFIDIKEHTELVLTINDKNTISNTNPDKLLNDYKDKLLNSLKGICDWSIHYDLENGDSYIVQFLPELPLDEAIKKHSEKAGGFKHLFTFYD